MSKDTKVITINPDSPEEDLIERAAGVVENGGVISFPTRCLYGIGADAMNPEAVARVFDIKKRPPENPLLILVKSKNELVKIVEDVPPAAIVLMDRFWPGKVTIVFKAKQILPAITTAGTGKIGVRMPGNPVSEALVNRLTNPVTGTSANLSDQPACPDVSMMPRQIIKDLDLVMDAGPLKGGTGSTVVDVTCNPPRVLREGEVSEKEIRNVLDKNNNFL